jgi:hypothetical protein
MRKEKRTVGLLIVSGFLCLLLETMKSTCKHGVCDAITDVKVLFFFCELSNLEDFSATKLSM